MGLSTTTRPRRSVLFTPATNARAMTKGHELGVDGVVVDLEDSVSPDAKSEARDIATAAVAEGGYGHREVIVRVNTLATAWGSDDIAAIAGSGADAILVPKVDSAEDAAMAGAAMDDAGAPPDQALWCMIETPAGVLNAQEIAAAHPRVACFVAGTEDLGKDLHARRTSDRAGFVTALALIVLAARAGGLAVLDSVHADFRDHNGFAFACRQGRGLGFDGKTLIHPGQIAAANAAFAPDHDEIEDARAIIAAHGAARAEGSAIVTLDGRMIETLHVRAAEQLVALADAIAAQPD